MTTPIGHSEITHRGRLLEVEVRSFTDEQGRRVEREIVHHPGAAVIVPVRDDGQVVLIRNARIAVDETLWELPAGTLERGEDPARTAARELREETGYEAASITPLAEFFTSPGFLDERLHVFVAERLSFVGQQLEAGETIEVETVGREDALAMIDDGRIRDGKTIAGLLLWDRLRREGGRDPMSWSDRRYDDDPTGRAGGPGGDWQGVRPSLDNPMTWSMPLMRVRRISVRVHLIFLLFVIVQLARARAGPSRDPMRWDSVGLVALDLASLFVIVLLHEFGHCFACRFMHGEANEILMWPLGGLAFCRPPQQWVAHLVTAVGGPMVNVLIFILLAPVLGALTGVWWGVALPNPLVIPAFGVLEVEGVPVQLMYALYSVHSMSLIILLFNLLPIFPLDGGRIVQAVLWPRFGYGRSMRLAVYAGYVGAIGLFVFGAVIADWMVIGIAFFGGITCYFTIRQLQFTESVMGTSGDVYAASRWSEQEIAAPVEEEPGEPRRERRRAETDQEETQELDRILAKIAEQGMDSLSAVERKLLKRATERKRTQS